MYVLGFMLKKKTAYGIIIRISKKNYLLRSLVEKHCNFIKILSRIGLSKENLIF